MLLLTPSVSGLFKWRQFEPTTSVAARAGYGSKKNEGKNTRSPCTQRLKKRSIFGLNALTWQQIQVLHFFLPSARIVKRSNTDAWDRRSVLKLVEKWAKTSGILKRVCCHSFRATGVTEYMNSGGTIEIAQRIAGHTSPATTRIYDRSGDRLTLQEIERVQIGKKHEIQVSGLSLLKRGFYARKMYLQYHRTTHPQRVDLARLPRSEGTPHGRRLKEHPELSPVICLG